MGYVKGNEAQANDLSQEVFIKVHQHWDGFKGKSARSTWVFRIAVNTCLNQLRIDKKFQKVGLDQIAEVSVAESKSNEHLLEELYRCINTLNTVNKSIILLELEGLPQSEIADVIGVSHGSLRTRINRIKKQLSKCIKHE